MPPKLSARRLEVLSYMFMGKTNEEIAEILGLGYGTIKNHVVGIMLKLGARNRQNAVYLALKFGLLQPPQLVGPPLCPPQAPPAPMTAKDWVSVGNVHLSPCLRVAMANGKILDVSAMIFKVLEAFLRRPGLALTRQQLLDHTHGDGAVEERSIDIHVHRLRNALQAAGADHDIKTEVGIGYRLVPLAAPRGVTSH